MKEFRSVGLMVLIFGTSVIPGRGQGFLPPSQSTGTASDIPSRSPLAIGDVVPLSLKVTQEDGSKTSLLSYKSYLDVLVVAFFSPQCHLKKSQWPRFRRLNEHFKDWRVAFLAVNTAAPETLAELTAQLKQEKLFWPIAQDVTHEAAAFLQVSGTPEVLIIDEGGVLRYRGPIDSAPPALDAIIGHVDAVPLPEPPLKEACAL